MQICKRLAALGLLLLAASAALAQTWPVKPIRVIVPQAPGGGSDLVARLMSTEIEKRLGQPFVIENRPGGNDSIAPDAISKAPPDGYTIGVVSSSFSVNQTSVGIKLPYDSQKDFAPIAPMVRIPMVVMVNSSLPVNDLKSLVALSKLPDIPTVAESYPGFDVVIFYGFVAPAGTPPDIVNKLNTAISETIAAITPKLIDMGNEPLRMSPADFKAFLAKDLATWHKIVETVK